MNINSINMIQPKNSYTNSNTKSRSASLPQMNVNTNDVAFKGGLGDYIGKLFGEKYAQKMLDADWTRSLAKSMSKVRGSMTEHMATAGSLITSGVYMGRTLTNKELDSEKKKTLSINQCLCFIIPTYCAYRVNSKLAGINKSLERRYSGLQAQKIALGEISAEKAAEILKKKSDRLKGFKTLASLATFTLIYRYITPVIITPIANMIGGKLNNKVAEKKAQTKQVA